MNAQKIFFFWMFAVKNSLSISDEEYAKMPPVFHLDDFDDCLLLKNESHYCSLTVQLSPENSQNHSQVWRIVENATGHPGNFKHDRLRYGICVPKYCPNVRKTGNLSDKLSECFSSKLAKIGMKGSVTEMHCETDQNFFPIDGYDITVAISFGVVAVIIIFSSLYTKSNKNNKGTVYTIALCFSIIKNWEKLKNSNPSMGHLQGIRFITMMLILFGHNLLTLSFGPIANTRQVESSETNLKVAIQNITVVVQVFFVMSGLLLAYFTLSVPEKRIKFLVFTIIKRYIRITSCLVVVMAFTATWFSRISRGPVWNHLVGNEYRNCRNHWWRNLLFINNYYYIGEMCILPTWYLAVDTQLYVASIFVVGLMWKYPRFIKLILGSLLILGLVIPAVTGYISNAKFPVMSDPEKIYSTFSKLKEHNFITFMAYTYLGSYTQGLITGYLIYLNPNQQMVNRKRAHNYIWWLIFSLLMLTTVYLPNIFYYSGLVDSRIGTAIGMSILRNMFACLMAFFIFGIAQRFGGMMGRFLSWSPFRFLGTLTYCAYLVHFPVQRVRVGQIRHPQSVSLSLVVNTFVVDMFWTYLGALMLCLFIELPTAGLLKLMMTKFTKGQEKVPRENEVALTVEELIRN